VELDVARRKYWDAVDAYPGDLVLIGADGGADQDSEIRRLRAAAAHLLAERDGLKAENAELRRNQTTKTSGGSDAEFEQLLRENGQLRQYSDQVREQLYELHGQLRARAEGRRVNPVLPVPPVPPVPTRR
jgi:hypothetical protein